MDITEALLYGRNQLRGGESPEIDSQVLLCYVLECQSAYLHSWSDKLLSDAQQAKWFELIELRREGQPVAHLTGQRGFWSLDLKVTADTLIPRPDTELLVSLALEKLRPEMKVADLGTGSGAVALSLASEQAAAYIYAMDYSMAALSVAKENAVNNRLLNVTFWQGSWLEAVADNSFDLIISNPPYIEQDDPHLTQGDVRFEPLSALTSGVDGLDDIRLIIEQSLRCLKKSGYLLLEHGYHQAEQIQQLLRDAGFSEISSHQDFGGNDRVTMGQLAL